MKFLIGVVVVQLMMLGAGVYGAYVVYDSVKSGVPIDLKKHKAELLSKYKPSDHTSEEQHKFEASVKRTD